MKEYLTRLSVLLKRQLTNKTYVCFLAILPLCILIARIYTAKNDASDDYIPTGFYIAEENDGYDDALRENLAEISGRLKFIEYDDPDKMINDTKAYKLECSYIFTDKFFKGFQKHNYKNTISVFSSPQTVLTSMTNEVVFAAALRTFGENLLYSYIDENPDLFSGYSDKELKNALHESYFDELMAGANDASPGSFEIYDYNYIENPNNGSADSLKTSVSKVPVHEITALFMFLCALIACSDYCLEAERGTLNMLSPKKRFVISSCFLQSYLIPAAVSSAAALILSAAGSLSVIGFSKILYEFFALLFYFIILTLFGMFLNMIIKKSIFITSLIPVMIIGSLIFCPVIINLSAILPAARVVEKLFLPYYYLILF